MSRLSRPAWLTTGLLIGAIVVPAVSVAATAATVVVVRGPSNHSADVTGAGQIRATEMDPTYFVQLAGSPGEGACEDLGAASTTRGYVIKHVNFNLYTPPIAGEIVGSSLFVGSNCTGARIASVYANPTEGRDIALGAGVALTKGTHVSVVGDGGPATVDVYGYTVPTAAVTHNPTVKGSAAPAAVSPPTTKKH